MSIVVIIIIFIHSIVQMTIYAMYVVVLLGFYMYLKMNNSKDLFGDPEDMSNRQFEGEEDSVVDLEAVGGDQLGLNLSGIDINPNELSEFLNPADTSALAVVDDQDFSRANAYNKALVVRTKQDIDAAVSNLVDVQKKRGMPDKMFGARKATKTSKTK